MKKYAIIPLYILLISLFTACTFDYGETGDSERENPDLIMENVEYVRIRSSDPIARFQAERAERYEIQGVMKLHNFSFEQYGEKGEEVNAIGKAGYAAVQIESGDIFMDNGVRIEVASEDIILETKQLEWKDEPKTLDSGAENEVTIYQESGTNFIGIGLHVNARNRTWEFFGNVIGTFISDEEEEETEAKARTPARDQTGVEQRSSRAPQPEGVVVEDKEDEWEKHAK